MLSLHLKQGLLESWFRHRCQFNNMFHKDFSNALVYGMESLSSVDSFFAEPVNGVEIYICRISEILGLFVTCAGSCQVWKDFLVGQDDSGHGGPVGQGLD